MSPEILTANQRRILIAVVVLVTLAAGLHPNDFRFRNEVEGSEDGAGMSFGEYGVAYTDPVLGSATVELLNETGFELALSLGAEAEKETQEGWAFIAQVHSGDDAAQFVVGRYSDQLIVMNGDDYRYRLKLPRISAELTEAQRTNGVDVVIRSGPNGSSIELNGAVVARKVDVRFQIPHSPGFARLVLGNSVYGTRPWEGELREFALSQAGRGADPVLSFSMLSDFDGVVPNKGSAKGELLIPKRFVVIEREFLAWPFDYQFEPPSNFLSDVLLNLFGFMPFGFVAGMVSPFRSKLGLIAVSFFGSAAVSLLIEYAQTWMPSRSSSMLDFLLNVIGGCLGALLLIAIARRGKQAEQTEG